MDARVHLPPGATVPLWAPRSPPAPAWSDPGIGGTEGRRTKLGVSRAHVLPGGLDFELFRPRPSPEVRRQLGLPEDKRLVLWAGVDRPDKRFDLALEAMQQLGRRVPDAELVKLSGKPHHLVAQYMSACDVLLLTSDSEGSPNVVKEAMASDLAVVATAVGDVPELIEGTDGCHVTSQDTDDIAAKLGLARPRGVLGLGRGATPTCRPPARRGRTPGGGAGGGPHCPARR